MFDIPDSSVEILSAAGGEISTLVKLHFELRLSLNDFKDIGNNEKKKLIYVKSLLLSVTNLSIYF